jgi:hypothetical protein
MLAQVVLAAGLAAAPSRAAGERPALEMRLSPPPTYRPFGMPSLGLMVKIPITKHWLVGGGYEIIQDYDAILWNSDREGHKPVVMSGLRVGAWYRGGAVRDGFTWSAGGLFTYSNSSVSLVTNPKGLDGSTYVVDTGAELSLGNVWQEVRIELFVIPAWSYGHIFSPAMHKGERYNDFTFRYGVTLAILFGS